MDPIESSANPAVNNTNLNISVPLVAPAVQTPSTIANTTAPSTPPTEYAGFGRRLGANIIDGFLLMLINLSVGFSLSLGGLRSGGLSSLIGFSIGLAYVIFFWVSQNGQTLGKRAMAVRVIKENGEPVDFATAIIRYIGYIISSIVLFLGFIWVLFDSKRQGWHDKIAKTYVVKTEDKPKTWLAVLLAVVYFFIFLGIFAVTVIAGITGAKTASQKNLQQLNRLAPQLTQDYINKTLNETHAAVDTYRKNKGFSGIELDNKLCAYAQRRLNQLSQLKDTQYDSARGFYEDSANSDIARAYFSEYLNMGELFYSMDSSIKAKTVVDAWTQGENSNLNKAEYTFGCMQADTKSLVFILGAKKK